MTTMEGNTQEQDGGGKKSEKDASYYPKPRATYEEVTKYSNIFDQTLKDLHDSIKMAYLNSTGGLKELDYQQLFVAVTSRGGIAKVCPRTVVVELVETNFISQSSELAQGSGTQSHKPESLNSRGTASQTLALPIEDADNQKSPSAEAQVATSVNKQKPERGPGSLKPPKSAFSIFMEEQRKRGFKQFNLTEEIEVYKRLSESVKAIYEEKAAKDRKRYGTELQAFIRKKVKLINSIDKDVEAEEGCSTADSQRETAELDQMDIEDLHCPYKFFTERFRSILSTAFLILGPEQIIQKLSKKMVGQGGEDNAASNKSNQHRENPQLPRSEASSARVSRDAKVELHSLASSHDIHQLHLWENLQLKECQANVLLLLQCCHYVLVRP
ncbi:hypothetical protein RJ641_030055 [Dillenia turbinata]|uniref:HMG box domain-containing protein n=1 Tax=Dillenia turbinata TaxID=194707 RepID=A0AAN8VUQ8_9MAGN